jgi:hypothetical protein
MRLFGAGVNGVLLVAVQRRDEPKGRKAAHNEAEAKA